jgi:hypothetical protein
MAMTLVIIGSPAFPWGSAAFRPYLAIGLALMNDLVVFYHVLNNTSTEFFSHLSNPLNER